MQNRRAGLAGALSALALFASPSGAAAAGVTDCGSSTSSGQPPARSVCGATTVPLDHSGRVPGTLELDFVLVPARSKAPKGTVAVLTGGPGQPATPLAGEISRALRPVRADHDLLFLDQRGTGSGAVKCRSIETPAAVRACAAKLGPQRPFLTTPETSQDLEDLRAELKIDKLTLYGVSYGARVAGDYARRFPGSTARVILDSPESIDAIDATDSLRQLGLPRVLREVCFPPSCKSFLSDPTLAVKSLVRRLQRKALRGTVVLPNGRKRSATLTIDDLYSLVQLSDLDPFLRADLPAAVASGVLGDPAPLLRLAFRATSGSEGDDPAEVNAARLLATTCVEGRLPWAPDSPVEGREAALDAFARTAPAARFTPFGPSVVLRNSLAAPCSVWPSTPRPAGVAGPGPDVPVLVLAGRQDLRTPLEDARRTASQYPNAQLLAVPGVGHSVLSSDPSTCSIRGIVTFLAGGKVGPGCGTRRPAGIVRAPFVPAALGDLLPTSVPGAPGRVASAVSATLLELFRDPVLNSVTVPTRTSVRIPGLRGGTASLRGNTLTLRSFEVVRGVRVSGTQTLRRTALTVTGPGGITGALTGGRGSVLRGSIAGRAVRLDLG